MPDVVHIGPNLLPVPPATGGAIERRMWSLARAQIEAGSWARVIADEAGTPQQPHPHPPVIALPGLSRARFMLSAARRATAMRPDVVHIHSRPEIAFALRAAGFRGAVVLSFDYPLMLPGIAHRAAGGGYGRGAARAILAAVDLLLPVSHFAAEAFRRRGGLLPAGRWAVLWNGTYCPPEAPHPLPELPVALFVGRFVGQKGADLFAAASERLPAWAFVAAGPRGEFHTRGDAAGMVALGRVDHRGPLPDDAVGDLMASATCLVLPTREWEVFGMVLVEALARGTSVVAPDAMGPAEILADAPAAHLFRPGDLDDLVRSIEAAADDDLAVRIEGQTFAHRFSWESIAARSFDLYGDALSLRAHS